MTNKLTLTEQEELFAKDCKLINLKYEYNGYTGDERWAIITELSVKELREKYPLVIERYSPIRFFIRFYRLLSMMTLSEITRQIMC